MRWRKFPKTDSESFHLSELRAAAVVAVEHAQAELLEARAQAWAWENGKKAQAEVSERLSSEVKNLQSELAALRSPVGPVTSEEASYVLCKDGDAKPVHIRYQVCADAINKLLAPRLAQRDARIAELEGQLVDCESHEHQNGPRYASELEACAEMLQKVHPIGEVKAIGRLEVAEALRQVLALLQPTAEPTAVEERKTTLARQFATIWSRSSRDNIEQSIKDGLAQFYDEHRKAVAEAVAAEREKWQAVIINEVELRDVEGLLVQERERHAAELAQLQAEHGDPDLFKSHARHNKWTVTPEKIVTLREQSGHRETVEFWPLPEMNDLLPHREQLMSESEEVTP